jgi:hypothetical protein
MKREEGTRLRGGRGGEGGEEGEGGRKGREGREGRKGKVAGGNFSIELIFLSREMLKGA